MVVSRFVRRVVPALVFVALQSGCVPTLAQSSAKPVVILFVGNSFLHGAFEPVLHYDTAAVIDENKGMPEGNPRAEGPRGPYGGIPAIFRTLTSEVGLNYEVHSELISGKALEFHYVNALPVIDQSKWDVVVMHDLSTGPVPESRTGTPERFAKYADLLEQTIHTANKSAAVYLYETWPRADLTYPEKGPYHGESIDAMAKDLHEAYSRVLAHNGNFRGVAAAGDAWMRAIHEGVAAADPYHIDGGKINLWGPDSYHPSSYGAYLNALVLLERITGKDPRQLGARERAAATLGIAPEMAVTLQRLAHEVLDTRH